MPSPLTVARNDYRKNKKGSTIYTPTGVAQFLFDILYPLLAYTSCCYEESFTVFDPAIGSGRLTDPWYNENCMVAGCDIEDAGARCHTFDQSRFEETNFNFTPNLVLCNPPFNGAPTKKLYPEFFLRCIFDLFGKKQPTVLFAPMGFRLNQRKKSKRWHWLRDCDAEITSIISLPLDIFPGVEFHCEILIFNIKGLKPHYFLPGPL